MKELKLGEKFEFKRRYCNWMNNSYEWVNHTGYLVDDSDGLSIAYSDEYGYFACRDLEDFEDIIEPGDVKILKEER